MTKDIKNEAMEIVKDIEKWKRWKCQKNKNMSKDVTKNQKRKISKDKKQYKRKKMS